MRTPPSAACCRRAEHAHDHFRVLLLLARLCAVLAVAGDVEDRPELVLQLERLDDQLLAAGEVLAGGDDRKRLLALEQGLVGMDELHGRLFLGMNTV
jgi:hypothetical protein